MNKILKKTLYESIMKTVAKQIKHTLNEANSAADAEDYAMKVIQTLESENIKPEDLQEIKQDILSTIKSLCEILKPVLLYNFKNNSDEELAVDDFNQTIERIKKML